MHLQINMNFTKKKQTNKTTNTDMDCKNAFQMWHGNLSPFVISGFHYWFCCNLSNAMLFTFLNKHLVAGMTGFLWPWTNSQEFQAENAQWRHSTKEIRQLTFNKIWHWRKLESYQQLQVEHTNNVTFIYTVSASI